MDTNWENWNEESLDYEDERMLEKKRQILERELAKGSSDSENDQMPKKKVLSKVIAQTPPPSQTSKKQQSTVVCFHKKLFRILQGRRNWGARGPCPPPPRCP